MCNIFNYLNISVLFNKNKIKYAYVCVCVCAEAYFVFKNMEKKFSLDFIAGIDISLRSLFKRFLIIGTIFGQQTFNPESQIKMLNMYDYNKPQISKSNSPS